MAKVQVKQGESIEKALRRFNREVMDEGIIDEIKKRQYFEKPSEVKKREDSQRRLKIKIANRRASR
ncbi:MAG: 30S ribosomal protein S21 [bacterium]